MIIGVTGNLGSGKDSVAEILQKMNFYHISFSDMIREEIKKRGKTITRDLLIEVGNELRERYGPDILAKKALEQIKDGENYVFTSIRNPAEVQFLQTRKDFLLVEVTAPIAIRLKRLQQRNRENDPKTLSELKNKEDIENSKNANNQQLKTVAKMAKIILNNDSDLEKLKEKVEKLVQDWLHRLHQERPDWDHYFMSIAEAVKLRCNCLSAKKGAVVVKDQQILSTGYNGTPKGTKHCTDGGCQRCTSRHLGKIKSGIYSEPCYCAHAEENAIVQAAYNGTCTKGAVMYTTFTPCVNCAKMIINSGIKEVVARIVYPDDSSTKLLAEAKVKLRILK